MSTSRRTATAPCCSPSQHCKSLIRSAVPALSDTAHVSDNEWSTAATWSTRVRPCRRCLQASSSSSPVEATAARRLLALAALMNQVSISMLCPACPVTGACEHGLERQCLCSFAGYWRCHLGDSYGRGSIGAPGHGSNRLGSALQRPSKPPAEGEEPCTDPQPTCVLGRCISFG